MQYLKPLITLSFWFNGNPPPFVRPVWIGLGILIVIIFVGGGVVKYFSYRSRQNPPLHRILSRIGRAVLWVGGIALLLYFFSYEQIPYISVRYWWALLAVGGAIWAVFITKDSIKRYPIEKRVLTERQAKGKYLP